MFGLKLVKTIDYLNLELLADDLQNKVIEKDARILELETEVKYLNHELAAYKEPKKAQLLTDVATEPLVVEKPAKTKKVSVKATKATEVKTTRKKIVRKTDVE